MESMQASFEAEARAKVEALKSKKKLEQDIVELESALDNANRGRAEADKVIKKLQQQIKDIEAVSVTKLIPPSSSSSSAFVVRLLHAEHGCITKVTLYKKNKNSVISIFVSPAFLQRHVELRECLFLALVK